MQKRPVIPLPYTPVEIAVQLATVAVLVTAWSLAWHHYLQLPETIAIHFNFSGEPDGYGSKETIFFVPAITTVVSVILTLLSQIPHQFNYLVTINEANAERQYRRGRMLLFVSCLLTAVLALWTVWKIGGG